MEQLELIGDNLAERHRYYNQLVKDIIARSKQYELPKIQSTESDINNLIKIDVAIHMKDVDYILDVLKCEDMLYVSRAIKHSPWLITDNQYAHIINPDYLHTQLFPYMITKAINKLIFHIKLNLKDEKRVEEFFTYYEEINPKQSLKWLPNCSVPFIKTIIQKRKCDINTNLFKRLCEKSITIFESFLQNCDKMYCNVSLQPTIFLLNTDTERYLKALTNVKNHRYPKFGVKGTDIIMKTCPNEIIHNFETYVRSIDLSIFAKYLKKEEIKKFLLNQAEKEKNHRWFTFDNLNHFIKLMPIDIKFEFVKQVFIDKIHKTNNEECLDKDSEILRMGNLYSKVMYCSSDCKEDYVWYQYAPFSEAFKKLTELINGKQPQYKNELILSVLLLTAGHDMKNIQTLLLYYLENRNLFSSDYQFLNDFLSKTAIHKYDVKTWNILDEVLKACDMYTEPKKFTPKCIKAVIILKVLHDEKVPDIIENNFNSNTSINSQILKLNAADREKIFNYFYNYESKKLMEQNVSDKMELELATAMLENFFQLLKHYKKNIIDYPIALSKLKEFMKTSKENSWKVNFSEFYNLNKSWRKYMFEDSITLHPTQDACVNALKHDPKLLKRHESEVDVMRFNDAMSFKQLLIKLRIYWSHSLANDWTNAYRQQLNQTEGHKAVIRGLCILLPREQLLEIVKICAPVEPKINWNNVDELKLSLQRQIAKNMHLGRPQPPPDAVLWYAKGDYLQYALPSLHSIFYNISYVSAHEPIMKLLSAQVSLQKHGIRIGFNKLKSEELRHIFAEVWKSTKNSTIKAVTFKLTFTVLCREKDQKKIQLFWELLQVFIDNLSYEEDKTIYDLLHRVEDIPKSIRASFCVKNYKFLKSLLQNEKNDDKSNIEWHIQHLAEYTRNEMESIDINFVTEILMEFINTKFIKNTDIYSSRGMIKVISAYLLCVEDEPSQAFRYEKILLPLMQTSVSNWGEKSNDSLYIKNKFQRLLNCLFEDLKSYTDENKIIPNKLFSDIKDYIDKSLPVPENYLMLTKWKFVVTLSNLLAKFKKESNEYLTFEELCCKSSTEVGKMCLEYLKQDTKLYFPCIYVLFSRAMCDFLKTLNIVTFTSNVCTTLLSDINFIQGYLTVIAIISTQDNKTIEEFKNIRQIIFDHTSAEIKMHYYYVFKKYIDED